jgi:hypothetical protein
LICTEPSCTATSIGEKRAIESIPGSSTSPQGTAINDGLDPQATLGDHVTHVTHPSQADDDESDHDSSHTSDADALDALDALINPLLQNKGRAPPARPQPVMANSSVPQAPSTSSNAISNSPAVGAIPLSFTTVSGFNFPTIPQAVNKAIPTQPLRDLPTSNEAAPQVGAIPLSFTTVSGFNFPTTPQTVNEAIPTQPACDLPTSNEGVAQNNAPDATLDTQHPRLPEIPSKSAKKVPTKKGSTRKGATQPRPPLLQTIQKPVKVRKTVPMQDGTTRRTRETATPNEVASSTTSPVPNLSVPPTSPKPTKRTRKPVGSKEVVPLTDRAIPGVTEAVKRKGDSNDLR